jgi:nucleoside-diphosphate-sugar epimerase
MVIGNGAIAKSFMGLNHNDLCVFASGVSNSNEINKELYDREFALLEKTIHENQEKKLIYFSTSSVETKPVSPYIKHKIRLEHYIEFNSQNHLILRLPNVVSGSENKHQLIGYFYDSLINQKPIAIISHYERNLIDVVDIPKIVDLLLKNYPEIKKITVGFLNQLTVKEIILILEEITNSNFVSISEIGGVNEKKLNNDLFLKVIDGHESEFNIDPFKIIKKYYSNENISPSIHI